MTKYTGNALIVNVASSALSSVQSVEINESAATYDTTVAGEASETHLPGKTNGTCTINCLDLTTEANFDALVPGTSYAIEVLPQGGSSPKRAFTATVTGRQRPVTHNAVTPITFSLAINGAITDT